MVLRVHKDCVDEKIQADIANTYTTFKQINFRLDSPTPPEGI